MTSAHAIHLQRSEKCLTGESSPEIHRHASPCLHAYSESSNILICVFFYFGQKCFLIKSYDVLSIRRLTKSRILGIFVTLILENTDIVINLCMHILKKLTFDIWDFLVLGQ